MTGFTRGFKLHTPDGDVFDGAAFPSDRHFVTDHPESGLASAATSMEHLLEMFPPGTRVEWPAEETR